MTDEVFHEVAYTAENQADILAGLHEFLDKTWLLPPGRQSTEIQNFR